MKRKSWMVAMAALVLTGSLLAGTEGDERNNSPEAPSGPAYNFNNMKSTLYWEGSKPGGKHHGTIEVVSGTAETDGSMLTGGSFEIDMKSISNDDVGNEEMKNKLVGHLKSEDFFYVEKYPTAKFEITSVKHKAGSSHTITGDLTIRGKTHEISFPAEVTMDDNMIHAKTEKFSLDRTQWGVNHMSKSVFAEIKDRFIDDQMIVMLDVHLNR